MTQEELNDLGIHSLRNIARKAGVHSPTTKKKEELIFEIIEISEGRQKPHVPKSNQGRPPKREGLGVASGLMHGIPYSALQSSAGAFRQAPLDFSYDDFKTIKGYVEIVEHNAALLWIRKGTKYESCYIPSSFVESYNLLAGDLLNAKIGMADNQLVVSDIYSINGCPINKFDRNRKSYYDDIHQMPTTNIIFEDDKFKSLNIKFGENVYFYGNNPMMNTNTMIDLLNSCKADNKIYINTTIVEKNRETLNKLKDVEFFATEITENINVVKRLVTLASERAKRIFEKGESVVVVVDDVSSLSMLGDEMASARNVMSLTKNSANGSISIFAVMSKDNGISIFERLADKKYLVEEHNLFIIE